MEDIKFAILSAVIGIVFGIVVAQSIYFVIFGSF